MEKARRKGKMAATIYMSQCGVIMPVLTVALFGVLPLCQPNNVPSNQSSLPQVGQTTWPGRTCFV